MNNILIANSFTGELFPVDKTTIYIVISNWKNMQKGESHFWT